MISFKAPPLEKTTKDFAAHVPDGRVWAAKNIKSSNQYKIIKSLAVAFNSVYQQIQVLSEEFNINTSFDLLEDWETSVGIPDDCQGRLMDLVSRRQQVIDKFKKVPLVDIEDIQTFIESLIGQGVTLITGVEAERLPATLPMILSSTNSLFKLYLTYDDIAVEQSLPYTLPFRLGSVQEELIVCATQKILPANVELIIRRS